MFRLGKTCNEAGVRSCETDSLWTGWRDSNSCPERRSVQRAGYTKMTKIEKLIVIAISLLSALCILGLTLFTTQVVVDHQKMLEQQQAILDLLYAIHSLLSSSTVI